MDVLGHYTIVPKRPPAKSTVGCGQGQPAKGRRPPSATPRGLLPTVYRRPPAVTRKGRSTAGSTLAGRQPAGKGTARMGCRLQGRLPTTVAPIEVPAAGVAAPWQSGCRRARAAVACAGVAAAMTQ
ncbi:hypothetical protein BHM03_00056563 [Ensete ventricosum]|nr:hypothetical protein BHM03_00056563 [Ensete ventricosum]